MVATLVQGLEGKPKGCCPVPRESTRQTVCASVHTVSGPAAPARHRHAPRTLSTRQSGVTGGDPGPAGPKPSLSALHTRSAPPVIRDGRRPPPLGVGTRRRCGEGGLSRAGLGPAGSARTGPLTSPGGDPGEAEPAPAGLEDKKPLSSHRNSTQGCGAAFSLASKLKHLLASHIRIGKTT